MSLQNRKIVIIGAGHVGSHAGYALISQGLVDEIVYIDVDRKKAEAQALDLFDATNYLPSRAKVRAGDYSDGRRPADDRGRRPTARHEQRSDQNGYPSPDH